MIETGAIERLRAMADELIDIERNQLKDEKATVKMLVRRAQNSVSELANYLDGDTDKSEKDE
ncbi:MAG: hypothetical protein OXC80_06745 [Gammaproteobacteria bacterium]|nr:hypothetical protein [Gammaproteobacteria bacterium]